VVATSFFFVEREMSQFDPSPAMGVASGADGFGSCETVGFVDDEEEKPMVPKVAWYCIAFALVAGLCAYSSGYVTNPALAADPRLQPGYSLPTAAATGHVSTSKITVAQIRAERKRLALISHKVTLLIPRLPTLSAHLPVADEGSAAQDEVRAIQYEVQGQ
jgi:hypothetical protein